MVARLILFSPLLPCRWVDLEVTETMLDAVSVKEKGPIFIVGSTCKVASHTVRTKAIGLEPPPG